MCGIVCILKPCRLLFLCDTCLLARAVSWHSLTLARIVPRSISPNPFPLPRVQVSIVQLDALRQELQEERRKRAEMEAKLAQAGWDHSGGKDKGQASAASFDADCSLAFEESAMSYDPDRLMERTASPTTNESASLSASFEDAPRPGHFAVPPRGASVWASICS
jgi:hypothetical protein